MNLQFELNTQQIKDIASCISLKDVHNYIENHKEEYEQFLKNEEQQENTEEYENNKKDYHTIWQKYIDDTVCIVPINGGTK